MAIYVLNYWLEGEGVYGADGAAAPYTRPTQRLSSTTTHPKTRCRKPYAVTQHLMLLMMGVCTRNMSS